MERAAGFAQADAPEVKLANLQALLAATAPPLEDMALIAELLSLPIQWTSSNSISTGCCRDSPSICRSSASNVFSFLRCGVKSSGSAISAECRSEFA